MDYDTALGTIVLFGGIDGAYSFTNGTYTYSGGVWANLTSAKSALVTEQATLAYDPSLPGALLFGGCNLVSCPSGSTWALTG